MAKALHFLFLFLHLSQLVPPVYPAHTINGPIKTIVVLVMENRSFDHMLGYLNRRNPDIDGLSGAEFNVVVDAASGTSHSLFVSDTAEFVDPDPGHSYQAIQEQVFGPEKTFVDPPPMSGFAINAEKTQPGMSKNVMRAFRPEVVPVTTALATEYAVFDRWFASVPSSTQPNRFFVHSATSHGLMSNNEVTLAAGLPQRTIMEDIADAGLTFGIYYQNLPTLLFYKSMRVAKYSKNFIDYNPHFKADAAAGTLPNYVVIEQRYFDMGSSPANDDHPSHDISQGQMLLKEVYETLRASPQWDNMLIVITYDEHGGFYDHVPTPVTGVPSPDGIDGIAGPYTFKFDRLGVRVPTIVVSPWVQKGFVEHKAKGPMAPFSQYEHSSIPATVRKLFNLPSSHLTAREAWAGTFDHLVMQQPSPRIDTPATLVSPAYSLRHAAVNEEATLTEFQSELVLLAASLNGGKSMKTAGEKMTVAEADFFIKQSVSRFLNAGRAHMNSGGDPNATIHVQGVELEYRRR
ncbi:hypothetical protein M758_9G134400 [Ceratodon purpureus]|nr:hypothetical protein M758_9G134400 [Ceratodon purpureus]